MAYSQRCTGTYIGQFTMYDPVEFNKALNEGCTIQEATHRLKTGDIVIGSAFYPLYSYTVDGVEYIRASYRLHEHFGRSIGQANMWMKGTQCTVCYDPDNPGDAVIEDKSGMAEAGDVVPGSPKKSVMKWIWIAAGVLVAMRILHLIVQAFFLMKG